MSRGFIKLKNDTFLDIWKELNSERGRLLLFGDSMGHPDAEFKLYHKVNITGPNSMYAPIDLKRNREYLLTRPLKSKSPMKSNSSYVFDTTQTNVGNYKFSAGRLFVVGCGLFDEDGGALFIPKGVSSRSAFDYAISHSVRRINEKHSLEKTDMGVREIEQMVGWVMKDLKDGGNPVNKYFYRKFATKTS